MSEMTPGTVLNEQQNEGLQRRYEQQRFDAQGMLNELRKERSEQLDFITDTRTIQMVPVRPELQEQMPEVEEQQRLHSTLPQVAIIPKGGEGEDWYAESGPVVPNSHAHEQVAAHLKIPTKYYRRMLAEQPDLLTHNVNRIGFFRD